MLSALASALVLGLIPSQLSQALPLTPPGIEIVSISAPNRLASGLVIPAISASGALLIDAESGQELFSIAPDEQRPMASLTKIMTALLIVEHHALGEIVTVPLVADDIGGSTIGLRSGQRLTVRSLLYALLLPSANDAAYTLATYDSHSVGGFVQRMNERARSLGLRNTYFANPAGLHHDQQFSTPRDIAWLTLAALKNKDIANIVSTRTARIATMNNEDFSLRNTNEMLHTHPQVFGVKTGTTDKAGECLVILFSERHHMYLLVLLGSSERYADGLKIMEAVRTAVQ